MYYVVCKLLEPHESMTANCMFMLITTTFINNKKDSCLGGLRPKLTHTIEKKKIVRESKPILFIHIIYIYIYIIGLYASSSSFFTIYAKQNLD